MNSIGNSPAISTPLTDFMSIFGSGDLQAHGTPQCKLFEMKYFDCLDAYGLEKSYIKCKDIFNDLQECKYGQKQEWRFLQMRAEREKQIKEGKLEKKFSDSPNPEVMYDLTA